MKRTYNLHLVVFNSTMPPGRYVLIMRMDAVCPASPDPRLWVTFTHPSHKLPIIPSKHGDVLHLTLPSSHSATPGGVCGSKPSASRYWFRSTRPFSSSVTIVNRNTCTSILCDSKSFVTTLIVPWTWPDITLFQNSGPFSEYRSPGLKLASLVLTAIIRDRLIVTSIYNDPLIFIPAASVDAVLPCLMQRASICAHQPHFI